MDSGLGSICTRLKTFWATAVFIHLFNFKMIIFQSLVTYLYFPAIVWKNATARQCFERLSNCRVQTHRASSQNFVDLIICGEKALSPKNIFLFSTRFPEKKQRNIVMNLQNAVPMQFCVQTTIFCQSYALHLLWIS